LFPFSAVRLYHAGVFLMLLWRYTVSYQLLFLCLYCCQQNILKNWMAQIFFPRLRILLCTPLIQVSILVVTLWTSKTHYV
jgi:hypothetical protein